jgi:hypothetical protein
LKVCDVELNKLNHLLNLVKVDAMSKASSYVYICEKSVTGA